MQLQRAAGNQAVLQLMRARSGAFIAPRPPALPAAGPSSHMLKPAEAGEAEPAPALVETPQIAANLAGEAGYAEVYGWLKEQANASKKSALFGFFDALIPEQKMSAIRSMAGGSGSITIDAVKKIMLTGIIFKSVDWDKFSIICRQAKLIDTTDHNADKQRDYASYAAIGSSGAAGGVSGSASFSKTLGASGASGTALVATPIASGLSGVASVSQIYNATQNYDSAMSAAGKAQIIAGEGASGAGDLARFTAGTVNSAREASGMALNSAATVAAGAGAIVGGAAYMIGGAAGYIESGRNAKKLGQVEQELAAKEGGELTDKQLLAANLGRSTQEMNKSKSGMTAVKGAMMIAGGAMLIAAAASPAGPILIGMAAALGGVAAIAKFYKQYKRKEAFIDKALKLEEAAALPENKDIERSKLRQSLLEQHGFNDVDQCYAQLITDLAAMLFDSGVVGDDQESLHIIEGMGLHVDKEKKTPGKELIAKKLHT